MPCPQCQHENPADTNFCRNCGTRLTHVCPQCQQVLPLAAKFCMACGQALTAPAQSAPSRDQPPTLEPRPLDAERRQLTVMFCDLVGSTTLSGQLDPEDLRDVIRAYQATCAAVISRFEGYIAQYLGDGLLVYFGYPQAHEDDAQRAVRAGLDMLEAMDTLSTRVTRERGMRLAIRLGIHTGLVVVGEIGGVGRYEQLALGETPNIAARIQEGAEPGATVISASTYRLIQDHFACQELGQQTLRGVPLPMMLYRVLGERGVQSRFEEEVPRYLTPLVGRVSEISRLVEDWQRVREGMGQVVVLSGEAGIGKSRLIQELKTHLAADPHIWLECRCLPYQQHSVLYPLIELLQRLLQLRREDTPEEQLAKLERMLRQCRMPLEETVPLFAALLALPLSSGRYPSMTLPPLQQRQKTLEALRSILEQLATQQPVLFIVEGLHCADPSTLALLRLLIDKEPLARVLMLLTYRPDFLPPWTQHAHLTSITLHRLPRHQIGTMMAQLTAGKALPLALHQQIVSRADGVPLFIEELTKMVLESGLLREADHHYELIGPLPALAIPTSLQDSLMARLDRLVTAKGIAQLGAVIGRQFSYTLLHAVSQLDDATLQRELGQLIEAELLYQRDELPQATYIFKHTLIQEAAYQSLLKSTRQRVHQQIAQVLAAQFPEIVETQPALLAHHATEAGLTGQAMAYWQQAGQHALEQSANVEAVVHLRRGLALLPALPDSAERTQQELDLQAALGPALIPTKGYAAPDVERAYTRARELCQQVGETSQLFPVLRGLWVCYEVQGQLHLARGLGEQLLDLAHSLRQPALFVEAHRALGNTLFWLGELAAARVHLEQGMARYDATQHHALAFLYGTDPRVVCLAYTTWIWWLLGSPDRALASAHEALTLAQSLAHTHSVAAALHWMAVLRQLRREKRAAHEGAEELIDLANAQGFPYWLAEGIILRGWALAMQGHTEEGIGQIQQGLVDYRATGAAVQRPYWLALQAEAYAQAGRHEEGLAVLDDGLTTADTTGACWYQAELYRLKGMLLHKSEGQTQQAAGTPEVWYRQALDLARTQQAKSLELRAALSLSRLWQQQGRGDEARELLAPVYHGFTEGFDTADLQEAQALLEELA